ncbi:hypothetical protein H6F43_04050 [Leptolyngbya sp. FACHB-36]|uniref:hypothetical protein n=1 Tax=Leptolyngbya sp. FACHB-36 TaxID=2692808 RepID=UPI001680E9A1|nr:hypothetical protein [Leptolyngbya sp. FACHB-36]MBD2019355.1 hypothetical protein [Leptolyngbya sp. FACHB-36]
MARQQRSSTVFLRHDGKERKDVFFRINPIAIRVQQGEKGAVVETLGGYYRDVLYSKDPQYQGLALADLTIEATTGVAYRQELTVAQWIWHHASDRKKNGAPADTYFFDLTEDAPYQGVVRATQRAYLIKISNFAWDDTVNSPNEIRFSMRCKVLRDLFWDLSPPSTSSAPNLSSIATGVSLPTFNPNSLAGLPDLSI